MSSKLTRLQAVEQKAGMGGKEIIISLLDTQNLTEEEAERRIQEAHEQAGPGGKVIIIEWGQADEDYPPAGPDEERVRIYWQD